MCSSGIWYLHYLCLLFTLNLLSLKTLSPFLLFFLANLLYISCASYFLLSWFHFNPHSHFHTYSMRCSLNFHPHSSWYPFQITLRLFFSLKWWVDVVLFILYTSLINFRCLNNQLCPRLVRIIEIFEISWVDVILISFGLNKTDYGYIIRPQKFLYCLLPRHIR